MRASSSKQEANINIEGSVSADQETPAAKEKGKRKDPLKSVKVTTIVDEADHVIKFDWNNVADIKDFVVKKDGKELKNINQNTFTDTQVDTTKLHTYEFVGKKMVDDSQKAKIKADLKKKNIKLSPQEEEKLYYDTYRIVKNVEPKSTAPGIGALATSKQWNLLYMSFIPLDYIPNPTYGYIYPTPGREYAFFSGDNRQWSNSSSESRYRTKTFVNVFVSDTGKSVGLSKAIGITKGYDANKKEIGSAKDTDEGIYLSNVNTSQPGAISFTLNHASNNPLVPVLTPISTYQINRK